ncbi:hypothetical protein [Aerosakkonema funiforme]|uniref:hypothetical protein n=1 Tax=Aerosakkonema funiforme TaxID=1246630 RepID=UPI0035BB3688
MKYNRFSHQNYLRLLSVGDIITIAIQIYLNKLKSYLSLSLIAHIWLIIPVYGWAKFLALSALISRLAFGELIGETTEKSLLGKQKINQRLGKFLFANFLLIATIIFVSFCLFLLTITILVIFLQASSRLLEPSVMDRFNKSLTFVAIISVLLVTFAILLIFLLLISLVYARFFIVDLPLAIEDNMSPCKALNRTWNLTNGFEFSVQWILAIAFLITLPIQIIDQIVIEIFDWSFAYFKYNNSFLEMSITIGLLFLNNAIIMPFWQAIKAVLYYDIRNRREGLGLGLNDSD